MPVRQAIQPKIEAAYTDTPGGWHYADQLRVAYQGVSYSRAAVSLRFDDGHANDLSIVKPELDSRKLPAGFAIVKDFIGTTNFLSNAQIHTFAQDGHELMSHSRTHGSDPTPPATDRAGLIDQTVTVTDELRTLAMHPFDSFVQPGTWTHDAHLGGWAITGTTSAKGFVGNMYRTHFASMEGYILETADLISNSQPYPVRYPIGHSHVTLTSAAGNGLADGIPAVDAAVQYGRGVKITMHGAELGNFASMAVVDFQALLEHIKVLRDAGYIDVLTPTAFTLARQAEYPLNLVGDPFFDLQGAGVLPTFANTTFGWHQASGTAATVVAGAGKGNHNAVQVTATDSARQRFDAFSTRSVRFDVWARTAAASGSAVGRLKVKCIKADGTVQTSKSATLTLNQTWQQMTILAGMHMGAYWEVELDTTDNPALFSTVSAVKT